MTTLPQFLATVRDASNRLIEAHSFARLDQALRYAAAARWACHEVNVTVSVPAGRVRCSTATRVA